MGQIKLWQPSFNGGELTPLLEAREDLQKYPHGCRRLRNFHGIIQGPARRRAGSRRVAITKDNGEAWLLPFIKGRNTAYMLELGDNYARFYRDRGQLLNSSSPFAPYEIATPWTYDDLTDTDGTFKFRTVQSNDVIYMCGGDGIKQINRLADLSWTISDFEPVGGPFDGPNISSTTIYASAQTGTVTLTASSAIFTADRVGSLLLLRPQNLASVSPWEPNQHLATNDLRRSDGKTYQMTTAGVTNADDQRVTGTVAPIHEEGSAMDGEGRAIDPWDGSDRVEAGLEWEFQDPGYGIVKITAVGSSGTTATATVEPWRIGANAQLPFHVVNSGNTTTRWAWGLFSNANGWPKAPTFFRSRFVLASSRRIAFSVPESYEEFVMETAGETLADNAFVVNIQSDRDEELQWLLPSNVLHVGTTGAEHIISELTTQQVFGPQNRKIEPHTAYGSNGVAPLRVGDTPLFVDASGLRVRAVTLGQNNRYKALSQNDLAEHITNSTVIQTAFAALPDSLYWGMRADGRLACLVFSEEQDVFGWSLHNIGGFRDASRLQTAKVRSIGVIPSPDATIDDTWLIAERYVDGSIQRQVEFLTEALQPPERWEEEPLEAFKRRLLNFQADQFFVDGGTTFDDPLDITDISVAGDGTITVTVASHGLSNADEVRIDEVVGMWQVNARSFIIENVTTNTFDLANEDGTIDGSAYTTYVLGGVAREMVDTISNLSPYEGETIQVLTDGAVHPDRTVSDGSISLQYKAARVHLGYGFKSILETERPPGGEELGSAQGQLGVINHIVIRMVNSLGGRIGPNEDMLDELLFRTAQDAMGLPPPLFSGDKEQGWPDGHSTDRVVVFIQDQPLPSIIEGFGLNMEINE